MAAKHGTRRRYTEGCRCGECGEAERLYRREYRLRKQNGEPPQIRRAAPLAVVADPDPHGRVETAVEAELALIAAAESRPGLAATALSMARLLDNPRAAPQQPAAAAKLQEILRELRKGTGARHSRLAAVKQMTKPQQETG